MLKQSLPITYTQGEFAAAFGRLCVETIAESENYKAVRAAAFGRLCVETLAMVRHEPLTSAAAFGRLCVETQGAFWLGYYHYAQPPSGGCVLKQGVKVSIEFIVGCSRLRAAVC